jgi:hypothetical protein
MSYVRKCRYELTIRFVLPSWCSNTEKGPSDLSTGYLTLTLELLIQVCSRNANTMSLISTLENDSTTAVSR